MARFRLWRQHSMSVPDTVRHGAREVMFESYPEVGFNFRMTDMQAAVGRVQLTRLTSIVDERRRLAGEYASRLVESTEGVSAPIEPVWARSNWQSYCVELSALFDQRTVMQRMLDCGCLDPPRRHERPSRTPVSESPGIVPDLSHSERRSSVA